MAKVRYTGFTYLGTNDDPISLPETISAGIGIDFSESIDAAFNEMLTASKANGMTYAGLLELEKLLQKYRDVFSTKLGPDPPAKIDPLVVTPIENAVPFRSTQRRYSKQQRDFISKTITELQAVGAVYPNARSK